MGNRCELKGNYKTLGHDMRYKFFIKSAFIQMGILNSFLFSSPPGRTKHPFQTKDWGMGFVSTLHNFGATRLLGGVYSRVRCDGDAGADRMRASGILVIVLVLYWCCCARDRGRY